MAHKKLVLLGELSPTDKFYLGGLPFVCTSGDGNTCIAFCDRNISGSGWIFDNGTRRGANNNFVGSTISARLEDFFARYPDIRTAAQLFDLDLLALNGEDDYGVARVKYGLPTLDHFRAWRDVYQSLSAIWLSTPASCITPTDGEYRGLIVSRNRLVLTSRTSYECGVRPIISLDLNTEVQIDEPGQPEPAPAPAKTACTASQLSDAELLAELRRRGI